MNVEDEIKAKRKVERDALENLIFDQEAKTLLNNNQKNYLIALCLSMGVKSAACRAVGLSWQFPQDNVLEKKTSKFAIFKKIQDWIKNDYCVDFAESSLYKLIKEKNAQSTIFYLKTKGKDHGFQETTKLDFGGEITINGPTNGNEFNPLNLGDNKDGSETEGESQS